MEKGSLFVGSDLSRGLSGSANQQQQQAQQPAQQEPRVTLENMDQEGDDPRGFIPPVKNHSQH